MADDVGTAYRCTVTGSCSLEISSSAQVRVDDLQSPDAGIVSPNGGEYWLLSDDPNDPLTQTVAWEMEVGSDAPVHLVIAQIQAGI